MSLSPRETEIVEAAGRGLVDKEICDSLGMALGTLKTHWSRIRLKLRSRTRTQAVLEWFKASVPQTDYTEKPTCAARDL